MWFRDVLLFKATKEVDGLIFKDQYNYIKERAKKSSYEGIENIIDEMCIRDRDKNNALDLADSSWKIYTQDTDALPQYIGAQASIERAFITQGLSLIHI